MKIKMKHKGDAINNDTSTLLGMLRSAPASRSSASTSTWPFSAAMKAGVAPTYLSDEYYKYGTNDSMNVMK